MVVYLALSSLMLVETNVAEPSESVGLTYTLGIRIQVCTMLWSCQDPLLRFPLLAFSSRTCICTWLAVALCETQLETNSNYNSLRAPGTNSHTVKMYQSPVEMGCGMSLC